MNIGELFVKLGFKADTKELSTMKAGLNSARVGAIALTGAVIATVVAVNKLISASLQSAVVLKNFEVQTGLSSQQLQQWSYVAEQNDVSTQTLIGSIKGLQKAQANLRMGQGNMRPFALLGISPTEDPFVVLNKLKERIKGLSPAIASSLLGQLGIGDEMLNILRNSNIEFDKLNKKFLLTAKEQENLITLNKSYKDFIFTLRGIRDRLVAMISPEVLAFIKALKNNFEFLFDVGKWILDLIEKYKWLGGIIAIVGAIALTIFAPWVALILGIILVVDDLWTTFKGGEGVIANTIAKLMGFKDINDLWKSLKSGFNRFIDDIKKGMDFFKNIFEGAFNFVKDMFDKFIKPIIDGIKGITDNKIIAKIMGKEEERVPQNNINNGGNVANNTNNIVINIDGATGDGKKIANDIKDVLTKQMEKTYYTTPVGV
ncbi:hypothetical protein EOM39_01340 [Candidatus Gracilibacteria bacterium]|nr:hypothetical protein [Candidatus Gracilibacteria bacterium]